MTMNPTSEADSSATGENQPEDIQGRPITIGIPAVINLDRFTEIDKMISKLLPHRPSAIILDFSSCRHLDRALYPHVGKMKIQLRNHGVRFFAINFTRELSQQIANDGVPGLFETRATLASSNLADDTAESPDILSPIALEVIKRAFAQFLATSAIDVKFREPRQDEVVPIEGQCLITLVSFSSADNNPANAAANEVRTRGGIRLRIPTEVVVRLQSLISKKPQESFDRECVALCEELVSSFLLSCQQNLGRTGLKFQTSIPKIFAGPGGSSAPQFATTPRKISIQIVTQAGDAAIDLFASGGD